MLLADSGSTKTDWLLVGPELISFQSAGFNPFYQTYEAILEGLQVGVAPQVQGEEVSEIFFYGAGCADPVSSRPIRDALAATFPDAATIDVQSDLLAAARALCGREAGIACILGTGSNNAQYDGQTIQNNIGSLGFWLGDEGSGAYLGKQLVSQYLHKVLPDELRLDFQATYPEVNRLMVLDRAYKQPFPNRFFGTFTPFLSRHMEHPAVQKLVKDAFRTFLNLYVRPHPNAFSLPIHFTGSIACVFGKPLLEVVAEQQLQPGRIQKSPMEGLLRYHQ